MMFFQMDLQELNYMIHICIVKSKEELLEIKQKDAAVLSNQTISKGDMRKKKAPISIILQVSIKGAMH